ncbi:MFS transporter [Arthrobacter sp. efr-133-TYG-104]|uniref:MFS transporter n=1 Tax=Arthrobacter sp. efr-133-TYG-104 TaxID=3040324 RepID=UPI00254DD2A4|nr:MFS transporter [Arthrobacter sp. efr-133-TYG-104]
MDTGKAKGRDTAKIPWGTLLLLAAAAFTAVTTELLPSGLLPQISRDLGVEESSVGMLTGAYAVVIVFTALPLSRMLGGRIPRRTLLIATMFTFAVSNVLLACSPTLELAVSARLLGGIAHGMLWVGIAPYATRIVPETSVGKAMAIIFAGNSVALAGGAPIGTLMGSALSWRMSFLVLAGVGIVIAALGIRLLPTTPGNGPNTTPSVFSAIRRPGVMAVVTAWPLLILAHFTLFTYIAPFLHACGLPDELTGGFLSLVGVASLIGIWIAGRTADSYPRRSLLWAVAFLVVAFGVLPLLGGSLIAGSVLVAIWGAAFGAIGIYNQAAILRAGGEHKDAANSLSVVMIQLGISIGSALGSLAMTTVGPQYVPLAASLPAAVALVVIFASRRGGYPAGGKESKSQIAREA